MNQVLKFRYPSSNTASRINNPGFITQVAVGISDALGRNVSTQEQRFIINFILRSSFILSAYLFLSDSKV